MRETQCFKIKRGTEFDKSVKHHFELADKWENVFPRVSELLDEEITMMVLTADNLIIELDEVKKPENKNLFKKDGALKRNLKEANQLRRFYKEIIKDEGLEDYEELRYINFVYGVMRRRGEELVSFRTSENDIYYKADFDLEKRSQGNVIPISEVEYQEKYLEEIKKNESKE